MTDRAKMRVFWLTILCVFAVMVMALVNRCEEAKDTLAKPTEGGDAGASTAPEPEMWGGYPLSQFHIDHDRFLPATDPALIAAEAATFLEPTDDVLGLLLDGEARAYPVRMLSYHHVVNDVVREVPIAVTY